MRGNLGNCERSRTLYSSYNPGLGQRFLSFDKHTIDLGVAHIESQHRFQYNNSCLTANKCTICKTVLRSEYDQIINTKRVPIIKSLINRHTNSGISRAGLRLYTKEFYYD